MAHTLDELAGSLDVLPMEEAVAAAFPRRDVSEDDARKVAHGGRLAAAGLGPGPVGIYAPDGTLLALVEETGEVARPLAVFVP
jgi:tRNA pseudouridine55 synthase